jgi:hypothetical protein
MAQFHREPMRQTMVVPRTFMFVRLTLGGRVSDMDVLDDLLAGTRARGGVFNLTIMDTP